MFDFMLEDYGTVWLVRPLTPEAADLLDSTIERDGSIWFGGALAVDHRYVRDLVLALGLIVASEPKQEARL